MPSSRVRGGKKLAAFMRASKRAGAAKGRDVTVGFHDRAIAQLAGQLEFGNPRTGLPERPAFRQGRDDLKRTLPGVVEQAVSGTDWRKGIIVGHSAAVDIGEAGRETIKASYLGFSGEGVGPAQAARKAGTPGEGRTLVGSEGPRLVERIEAKVDGEVT